MSGVAEEHRTKNLTGGEFCRWCRDHGLLEVDKDGTVGPCPMCERGLRADEAQWKGLFWRHRNPADLPNAPVMKAAPRDLNLSELRELQKRLWPTNPAETCNTSVAGLFDDRGADDDSSS